MWKVIFSTKQGVLATNSRLGWVGRFNSEITDWLDYPFLSCSALAIVILQLPACFTRVAFWRVINCESLTSFSCESLASSFLNAHTLEFFTHSHTQPLHNSHLNTRYLIAELQVNLVQNKANIWLNKFNLTKSYYQVFWKHDFS